MNAQIIPFPPGRIVRTPAAIAIERAQDRTWAQGIIPPLPRGLRAQLEASIAFERAKHDEETTP